MAWTPITQDTSWQDLAIAQEIADVYNKRISCLTSLELEWMASYCAEDPDLYIHPDNDMTVFHFIQKIQNVLAELWWVFCDPTISLKSIDEVVFVPNGLFNTAELSKGWRRISDDGQPPDSWEDYNDPGWSYGPIESKDLVGPWLFIDIQKYLSIVRRKALIPYSFNEREPVYFYYSDLDYNGSSFPNMNASFLTVGAKVLDYIHWSPHYLYLECLSDNINGTSDVSVRGYCDMFKSKISLGADSVKKTISVTGYARKTQERYGYDHNTNQTLYRQNDYQDYGLGFVWDWKTVNVLQTDTTNSTSFDFTMYNIFENFGSFGGLALQSGGLPPVVTNQEHELQISIALSPQYVVIDYDFDP